MKNTEREGKLGKTRKMKQSLIKTKTEDDKDN